MSWPSYPQYSDSGVEWLCRVPSGWAVLPLKNVATVFPSSVDKHSHDNETPVQLCNYTDVYKNERISGALDFMKATATPEEIRKFTLKQGDTIITKDSETADDIGISAYVEETLPDVLCGYHLSVVRPLPGLDGRFVKRLFDSHYLKASMEVSANGLTRVGLGQYAIDNLDIPLPPPDEQVQIADFLEAETGKIDVLIGKQEHLVATLREDRTATITHAVTRGLDPAVGMVQPHNAELPACPKHWTVQISLKRLAEVQTGLTLGKAVDPVEAVDVPYLRVANVQTSGVNLDEVKTVAVHRSELSRYLLRDGDVLMTEGGDIDKLGRGCVWSGEISPCIHQNHVFAVRCTDALSSGFLVYLLDTAVARNYFFMTAKKTTNLASTNSTTLGAFTFSLPPRAEQDEIVDHLNERCAGLDALIAKANAVIAVLREYRAALITDAVTGKIDVRAAVA